MSLDFLNPIDSEVFVDKPVVVFFWNHRQSESKEALLKTVDDIERFLTNQQVLMIGLHVGPVKQRILSEIGGQRNHLIMAQVTPRQENTFHMRCPIPQAPAAMFITGDGRIRKPLIDIETLSTQLEELLR